jgi:hypothetical protein
MKTSNAGHTMYLDIVTTEVANFLEVDLQKAERQCDLLVARLRLGGAKHVLHAARHETALVLLVRAAAAAAENTDAARNNVTKRS